MRDWEREREIERGFEGDGGWQGAQEERAKESQII